MTSFRAEYGSWEHSYHDPAPTVWSIAEHRSQDPIDIGIAFAALQEENSEWRDKLYNRRSHWWEAAAIAIEEAAQAKSREEFQRRREAEVKLTLEALELRRVRQEAQDVVLELLNKAAPEAFECALFECSEQAFYRIRGRWVCFNHIMAAYGMETA